MDEDDFQAEAAGFRDLLRDIPDWRLLTGDWLEVSEALRAAMSAVGAADAPRLRNLVADLELLSPLRMQARPGSQPQPVAAPEEVNMLIHAIELELGASGTDQDRPKGTEESDGGR